ncbi:hypothetical protein P3S68_027375 [Capsicum galapagoense]
MFKLTWINSHLKMIWPYVDEVASELEKASVEPILEQYRPVIFASLKFSKFTLGIFIIEYGSEGISMELEMQWDGNPSIILNIKTYLGVALPVQPSDAASGLISPMDARRPCDDSDPNESR